MIHPLRGTAPLLLSLVLAATVSGCSGAETEDTPDGTAGGTPTPSTEVTPTQAARPTKVLMGAVVGPVPGRRLRVLRQQVTPVIDDWLDTAYVGGEWPREVTNAFTGFTPVAARAARRDRRLVSGADLGTRIDSVVVTKRALRYDVLAVDRRPVGVTARVTLDYRTGGEVRTKVFLRGRVTLSRIGGQWRIFGYDLRKGKR